MRQIARFIGDRELAWIMLALASFLVWSTWGLTS